MITTGNSNVNTSWSIVRLKVDIEDSVVVVRGFQRYAFDYLNRFSFAIDDMDVSRSDLLSRRWYWEDPDLKMHELSVSVESIDTKW